METIVITWNSAGWEWTELPLVLLQVRAGAACRRNWSIGNTLSVPLGSRVFLLRQGPEPRGLMGSGFTVGPVFQASHWDAVRAANGDSANYVSVDLDVLLAPEAGCLLDHREFRDGVLGEYHWHHQASGQKLPADVAEALEPEWVQFLDERDGFPQRFIDPDIGAIEGRQRYLMVLHRKREFWLRDAKITEARQNGALRCEVPGCEFDFESVYGQIGEGFCHVHHKFPLSIRALPSSTKLQDLAIICPNCHAMIHRGGECRELSSLIPSASK